MRFKLSRNISGGVSPLRVYGPEDDLEALSQEAARFRVSPPPPVKTAEEALLAIAALSLTEGGKPRPRFSVYLSAPIGETDLRAGSHRRGPVREEEAIRVSDRPGPGLLPLGSYRAPNDPGEALRVIREVSRRLSDLAGLPYL